MLTPGPPNGHELLTGVLPMPDGQVLISVSGDIGRLLHGFAEFGRYPIHLIGMVALCERILFATGDGVAELIDRDVTMIKSNFKTASISAKAPLHDHRAQHLLRGHRFTARHSLACPVEEAPGPSAGRRARGSSPRARVLARGRS